MKRSIFFKNAVLIPQQKNISLDQEFFLTISGLFQIWSIFQSILKKSLLLDCTVIWLTIICMRNYNLHTENFTVLKQHWHVYMMIYWGPLMTTKVYNLLCSIWVLHSIPLTMMYFWKDLNLDSVSVEQPWICSSHTCLADHSQSWSMALNQNQHH